MKIYKIIFFNSMIMGTMIAVSSYSWMSMWMGLEINLLSVIPLFSSKKDMLSSESSMKYFITQAMASMVLLTSTIMMLNMNEFIFPLMNKSFSIMINTALMTKLGAAPFHFWFPEVIEGLNWNNSLILLTWQKIAPMMLIMNMNVNKTFILSIIIMCLVISTVSGFNQVSLRKIMAFSSINHIAWMLSTMMMSYSAWTIYFIIYSMLTTMISYIFNTTKSFYLNQLNNIMNDSKLTKLSLLLNFLSLGGLPPFLGFLPKWIVINWLTNNSMMMMTGILIVTTLIMLFIYMRLMMASLMLSVNEPKLPIIKVNNKVLMTMNMIMMMGLIVCTYTMNMM
uniref:NADH-ubiquinone oxidoreductase chain 2 n=1 Tax=Cteniopinus ruber TaxID=2970659 RepID=A0A976U6B8_9CUCU|nr:NADH dehydrogenase subunit 2 [Cteniopinus ruber]UVF38378.1 NADH dehydrogenase subunit 2 [Cteniopinus ruber]